MADVKLKQGRVKYLIPFGTSRVSLAHWILGFHAKHQGSMSDRESDLTTPPPPPTPAPSPAEAVSSIQAPPRTILGGPSPPGGDSNEKMCVRDLKMDPYGMTPSGVKHSHNELTFCVIHTNFRL